MGTQISDRIAGVDGRVNEVNNSVVGVRERLAGIDEKLRGHDREFRDLKQGMKETSSSVTDLRSWVPEQIKAEIDAHKRTCFASRAKDAEATGVHSAHSVDKSQASKRDSFMPRQAGIVRWIVYIALIVGGILAGAGVTITIGNSAETNKPTNKIRVHGAEPPDAVDKDRPMTGRFAPLMTPNLPR